MLVIERNHGYKANRKYVHGKGFIDSLTSSLRSIGSYVSQNKDLIAKPLLGAVGNLAATGLEEGTKALFNHIINKNVQSKSNQSTASSLDAKGKAILQNIISGTDMPISSIMPRTNVPVSNIIGSGIKKF